MMNAIAVVDGATVPTLNVVGESVRPLLTGASSVSGIEIFEVEGKEGSGPVPHSHPWAEMYVVLEGSLDILTSDTSMTVKAGDAVSVPGATVHSFRVTSPVARFLVVTDGEGAHAFFVDMDANVRELPRDVPSLLTVAARNQVTPA